MKNHDPADTAPSAPRTSGTGRKVFIGVVVLAALTVAGVAGWLYYEEIQARNEAVARLDQATVHVEIADATVLAVDEVVRAEIDREVGERAAELIPRVPGAREELITAIRLIGQARVDLPENEAQYAIALEESARTRIMMLDAAETILEYNVKAAAALDPALAAWALAVEAGETSVRAVQEYNKLTREGVTRSATLTREAEVKILDARKLFSEAATGFPEVDFGPYLEYCDEKYAALQISKRADQAYLAGRLAEANTLSEQYNAAEKALAVKAASLPASPAELIAAAYERHAAEATEDYFDARAKATEADARLREAAGREPDGGQPDAEPGRETTPVPGTE